MITHVCQMAWHSTSASNVYGFMNACHDVHDPGVCICKHQDAAKLAHDLVFTLRSDSMERS